MLLDSEPGLILYRSLVVLAHADADRRHVVHEEVGEVLRADHHQRIGPCGLQCLPHSLACRIERIPHRRLGPLLAARDAWGMTADTGKDQTHTSASRQVTPRTAHLASAREYKPVLTGPYLRSPSRI